ncbi:MAG: 4Fe-4S binding protein, partial [Erysipelotrichaceae bacterium]|nr:4Fe-4S binding protein [Erysipelotrichaceae bacterium]
METTWKTIIRTKITRHTQAFCWTACAGDRDRCIKSCKVKAISINEEDKAEIDNSKCISCGACVVSCPFGAISDKSLVLDIIKIL